MLRKIVSNIDRNVNKLHLCILWILINFLEVTFIIIWWIKEYTTTLDDTHLIKVHLHSCWCADKWLLSLLFEITKMVSWHFSFCTPPIHLNKRLNLFDRCRMAVDRYWIICLVLRYPKQLFDLVWYMPFALHCASCDKQSNILSIYTQQDLPDQIISKQHGLWTI